MAPTLGSLAAIDESVQLFGVRIAQALKLLLEVKHLYQSVAIEYADPLDKLKSKIRQDFPEVVGAEFLKVIEGGWFPGNNAAGQHIHPGGGVQLITSFRVRDVKLFCQTCERVEAFNLIASEDSLRQETPVDLFALPGKRIQVFVLSFLCQSCKSVPEVFMVRRQGFKLTNAGRAPMERIDAPAVIPKSVRSFYSGAVVAFQSGKRWPGTFFFGR
jgi:hypothetical protein